VLKTQGPSEYLKRALGVYLNYNLQAAVFENNILALLPFLKADVLKRP